MVERAKPQIGVNYTTKQVFAMDLEDEPRLQARTPSGGILEVEEAVRTSTLPDSVVWNYHGRSNGRDLFRHAGGNILQLVQ